MCVAATNLFLVTKLINIGKKFFIVIEMQFSGHANVIFILQDILRFVYTLRLHG